MNGENPYNNAAHAAGSVPTCRRSHFDADQQDNAGLKINKTLKLAAVPNSNVTGVIGTPNASTEVFQTAETPFGACK